MSTLSDFDPNRNPYVAIGGVGGSGTNLIARLVREHGVHIGSDLNSSLDNLVWTLLFKRREVLTVDASALAEDLDLFSIVMNRRMPVSLTGQARLLELASGDRLQHPRQWLAERARLIIDANDVKPIETPWGWKEPNTHVLLPSLAEKFPAMRYIHVVRHGLDMAFSANQNQLAFWGTAFGVPDDLPAPVRSLRYWLRVQRRARAIGNRLGDRFLWLNYDEFCVRPEAQLERLASFLGLPSVPASDLLPMIHAPDSRGRYRLEDCSEFSAEEVEGVQDLGFEVEL